jgi:predicted metalloprotease with PDZ domain
VDNYRITDDLLRIIAMKKVGDKITILINRAGIIQNLEVMLGKNPNASYGIQRVASATPQQEALLQQWLKL